MEKQGLQYCGYQQYCGDQAEVFLSEPTGLRQDLIGAQNDEGSRLSKLEGIVSKQKAGWSDHLAGVRTMGEVERWVYGTGRGEGAETRWTL